MSGAGQPIASYADHYGIPRPKRRRAASTTSADVERARELGKLPPRGEVGNTDSAGGPAVAEPSRDPAPAEPTHDREPTTQAADDDDDQGDDEGDNGDPGDDSAGGGGGRRWTMPNFGGGQIASAGAGWVLGVLVWGWVVLPFVKGGPAEVGKTLRAKFLNQAPDGSQLP